MPRLLFVDDEASILFGFERTLRAHRKEWTCRFSTDPQEALEVVSEFEPHVVVSDMRMPAMDGADLLAGVALRLPVAARLILSGDLGDDALVRLAGAAHQYLGKPCPSHLLVATLRRMLASTVPSDGDASGAARIGRGLPVPADAVEQIQRVIAGPTGPTRDDEVCRTLVAVPGLGLRVMQLATWTRWGSGAPPHDVREAYYQLGPARISRLLRGGGLASIPADVASPHQQAHWRLSALAATAAHEMAPRLGADGGVLRSALLASMVAASPMLLDEVPSPGGLVAPEPLVWPGPAALSALARHLDLCGIGEGVTQPLALLAAPLGAGATDSPAVALARHAVSCVRPAAQAIH